MEFYKSWLEHRRYLRELKSSQRDSFLQRLVNQTYRNRLWISIITFLIFLALIIGLGYSIFYNAFLPQEWKEVLFLILGAFIGSYNRVIDFWFNASERDREMIARADFEDDKPGIHFKGDGFGTWANKGSYNHNSSPNSFSYDYSNQDGSVCPCCGKPYNENPHNSSYSDSNNYPVID
jgi:hypothetical protein